MRWVRSERCARESCTIIGTDIAPCVILPDWWRGAFHNQMPSRPRRHHTNRRPYHTIPANRRPYHTNPRRHHTNRWGIMVVVTCPLQDSLRHFPHAWRFSTCVYLCVEHLRRTDKATGRRHRCSGSTTSHWTGRPGSDTSGWLQICMAGMTIRGPYSWFPISMRQLWM